MAHPQPIALTLQPSTSGDAVVHESQSDLSVVPATVPAPDTVGVVGRDITDIGTPDSRAAGHSWPPTYELVGTVPLTIDILVVLVEHSEFILLAALRRTCSAMYTAVGVRLRTNYENCLKPFVADVPLLDRLLVRYGAIISGSVALRFFLPRALWRPNDLDIYVPESDYESFIAAATHRRGLDFTIFPHRRPWEAIESREASPTHDLASGELGSGGTLPDAGTDNASQGTNDTHISPVFDGIREVRAFYTPSDRRVDIISVPSRNPVLGLKQFWASLVMNFLRPDLCVCGFPATTLEGVALLKPHMTPRDYKAADKYRQRGFNLSDESHSQLTGEEFWETPFFGARKALVAPFRLTLKQPRPASPLVRTDRGWVLSSTWAPPSAFSTAQPAVKDG